MTYEGPERRIHSCPVEYCGEINSLVEENKELKERIRMVAIISLSVLGVIVTVLLAMASYTLNEVKLSSAQFSKFVERHNEIMLRDERIHSTLVDQMDDVQERLEKTTDIQREIIQEVAILKKGRVR